MLKVEIKDTAFEEALERHEKSFDAELEKIQSDEKELKKMILKMKKTIIEQVRQNNSINNHARNAVRRTEEFEGKVNRVEQKLYDVQAELVKTQEVFGEAITLLKEEKKERDKNKRKGLKGFWDFLKCLIK